MNKTYNSLYYQDEFKTYLENNQYSKTTVKNYLLELSKALNYCTHIGASEGLTLFVPNNGALEQYINFLKTTEASSSSIHQSIYALRLFRLFYTQKQIKANSKASAINLNKTKSSLNAYVEFLNKEGVSKTTIRDYVADVNEYINLANNTNNSAL